MAPRFSTNWIRIALVALAAAALAACATTAPPAARHAGLGGTRAPYQVNGVWYTPREQPDYDRKGIASWYGEAFQGRPTATGEIFDLNAVTAAHTTLPLPSIVEVTNLDNGRKLKVRVNDRGPFVGDRIIDLSYEAARQLGFSRQGLARVRVRYVEPAPLLGRDAGLRVASARPSPPSAAIRRAPAPATPQAAPDQLAFAPPPARPAAPAAQPAPVVPAAYRIQAGAFSEEARARRVAAQLAPIAPAQVEVTDRGGLTLWRVLLDGPVDELQAYGLRERVAQAGFADARVVRPF